jgi:hypothetical protein
MKRLHRGTSQSMQGVSVLGCDVGAEFTPWVQVWGTCLGHQLLQILAANTSYNELLVQTDAVVTPSMPLYPSHLHLHILATHQLFRAGKCLS